MLDFSKTILEKVSFDSYLFHKELKKLILWLGEEKEEIKNLYQWCADKYGNEYAEIIKGEFEKQLYKD